MYALSFFFFFFSSRRRHTRCLSDWSSDVCSSDLDLIAMRSSSPRSSPNTFVLASNGSPRNVFSDWKSRPGELRSEERRVGKEGRGRGWQKDETKKEEKVNTGQRTMRNTLREER